MGCSLELTGDFQTFGLEILLVDVRCGRSKEERRNVFMYKVFFFFFFLSRDLWGENRQINQYFDYLFIGAVRVEILSGLPPSDATI